MYWMYTVALVLFATLSACEEVHLVPKHGIKSKHGLAKRDLSAADAEMILKTLMAKLGHSEDSELMHKKIGIDKEHYSYEPGMTDKLHTASMEESQLKSPIIQDYRKDKIMPLEKDDYEMKKDVGITEKDMMELLMKIKEISASESLDDPYNKKGYLGNPEEKYKSEREHLSKGPIVEKYGKAYEDIVQEEKFSDKDVSLAESLYHMKIAGDVETYPTIKIAPLSAMYDKKVPDEKLYYEDDHSLHSDEAYLKKVDEIGKSLSKEESFPHLKGDIEGYLKKAPEEDKSYFYEPKVSHPETAFKTADEKAIEEWKTSHKDIFAIEGGIFSDEKLKIEDAHHLGDGVAHGMNDELVKKLKSLGLDEELKLEGGIDHEINDEFMKKLKSLGLDKELKLEGGIGHEINDEFMKKLKSLGLDKELKLEGGIGHEINDELMKKLKSLGLDKELKLEGGIGHEINDELVKKLKSLGLDKEFKLEGGIDHEIDDELLKKLKSLGLDKELKLEGGIGHEINDELVKKLKSLGLDKEFKLEEGIDHEIDDELLKKLKSLGLDKEFKLEGGIDHEINDEFMKKLKSLGLDKELKLEGGIGHEIDGELMKKLKSLGLDKELKLEGGIAHEINDELMKKLKSLGLDKEFKLEGAHNLEGSVAHEINDELMKKLKETLGLDKELKDGVLHAEGDIAHEINDELMKKLKASLGFDKELVMEGAHHADGSISHEMNEELIKKLKVSLGLDKEFKMDDEHYLKEGVAHEMNDELMKKLKASLGLDKDFKMDDAHYFEGGVAHEMNDEVMKKLKESLGLDISHDELFHLSKELHKGEGVAEGSFAYEKSKEQAQKDLHVHLSEEELKKHMDEAVSFGAKGKAHNTDLLFEKGLTAEKSYGTERKLGSGVDKSLDGFYKDEILKAKETHAIDKSVGMDKAMFGDKAPLEPEVKHSVAHESSFAVGAGKAIKVHEDELLKKEKDYGADSFFFEGKDHILKAEDAHIHHDSESEKHHVETGAEKGHKKLSDLKAKFFELLRRVLHTRKCHLVTMRPGELLSIVNCVSRSKDPRLCEKFAACEKKMPIRVIKALEKCQRETIPGEIKRCTRYAPLYPSTEIPLKIFQCVAINVRELIPQEEKEMKDFEECARVIKAESCGRVRWFRGPH